MVEQHGVLFHKEEGRGKGPLEVESVTKGGEVAEERVGDEFGREGVVSGEGFERLPCLISVVG